MIATYQIERDPRASERERFCRLTEEAFARDWAASGINFVVDHDCFHGGDPKSNRARYVGPYDGETSSIAPVKAPDLSDETAMACGSMLARDAIRFMREVHDQIKVVDALPHVAVNVPTKVVDGVIVICGEPELIWICRTQRHS